MSRPLLALAAAAAALGVAACGGDDQEEFAEQANQICLDRAAELTDATREPVVDAESAEAEAEALATGREEAIARLEELEPPDDVADPFGEYVARQREAAEAAREAQEAAGRDDREAFMAAQEESGRAAQESEALAREAGLEICGAQLPAAEQEEIQALAEQYFTTSAPDSCTELVTERFIGEAFGGDVEDCERQADVTYESAEVANVGGIVPAADAELTLTGGPDAGDFHLAVVKEDGEWKIDGYFPQEPPEGEGE